MDRRVSAEQHRRSGGGGTSTSDKGSRAGAKARRTAAGLGKAASSSYLLSGDQQREQTKAIELLSSEIATVVRQQEEVHGILRRRGGMLRSLSDRVKSAIRGTDGEHDLRELSYRLRWLRQKEVQLREEKLLLLLKDVSSQSSLQAPGAVAAAVAAAASSAAEASLSKLPPAPLSSTPSKRRLGFRRSASSAELGGENRASGLDAVKGMGHSARNVWSKSSRSQSLSRRRSFSRSAPSPPPPPPPSPPPPPPAAVGGSDPDFRRRSTGATSTRQPKTEANASADDNGGTRPAGSTAGAHISSYKRAHLMARGGEAYLALSSEYQHQQYHSNGGVPPSAPIWRRPIVAHGCDASLDEYRTSPATFVGPTEPAPSERQTLGHTGATAVASGAGAGAGRVDATPPARKPPTPSGSGRGWQAAVSQITLHGAEVASEIESEGSPARLTRTRSTTRAKGAEPSAPADVVVARGGNAARLGGPLTVSSSPHGNGINGARSSPSKSPRRLRRPAEISPAVVSATAPPPALSATAAGPGGNDGTGGKARRPRAATWSDANERIAPLSARLARRGKAAAEDDTLFSPAFRVAARGTRARAEAAREAAKAQEALRQGPPSSSFEAPSEIERLVPAARRKGSPPAAATAAAARGGTAARMADPGALVSSPSTAGLELTDRDENGGSVVPLARDAEERTRATSPLEEAGEDVATPPSYDELVPASYAAVTTLAVDGTRGKDSPGADCATATASPSTAAAPSPCPSAVPDATSPQYRQYYGKHPLAGMRDLLSSCFALLDATDGNSNLPEGLRKEMKHSAIAAARSAEIAQAVSLETPPSVWVSQYEDMSKKYGLGFLLSDRSSGVAFKDGTKIALDSRCRVFEYMERATGGGSGSGSIKKSSSPLQRTSGAPPTTSESPSSSLHPRQQSRHYGRSESRSGSGGELQQQKQSQKEQRWLEELPRIVHALHDYPARYAKKVVIAQKIRKLLLRAAIAEKESAARATAAAAAAEGVLSREVAANAVAGDRDGGGSNAGDGGSAGGTAGFGSEVPLIFVDDWKRTRSSWIFRLSNRTVQVIFLDATEIVLTEEARLITYADRGGRRETIALLRALEEDRMDVIVRVRECYSLIKKLIAYDEERGLAVRRR